MKNFIHSSAIVNSNAKIGKNVQIDAFSIIHGNVEIADNVTIGAYCELGIKTTLADGSPLIIGSNSIIRSHSVFYESSTFEDGLVTGHHVTVRENTNSGKGFRIGTFSDIQGNCYIGDYVRLHSNVHIGMHSKIGNFVWIYPNVILTNDPHPPSNIISGVKIDDYAVIATMSVIFPGVVVGKGSFVGAHSSLRVDSEPGMLYSGNPARKIGATSKIKLQDGSNNPAYPWMRHFTRNYPDEIIANWKDMYG